MRTDIKSLCFILAVSMSVMSCRKSLTSLNTDPENPSEVPAGTLLTAAEKSLGDILSTPAVNYNVFRLLSQQWTQTTYIDESNYNLKLKSIPDNFWNALYSRVHLNSAPNPDVYAGVLSSLHAAAETIKADKTLTDETVRKNQQAVVELLMVYTWSVIVNTYGNVPYTEALDFNNPHPKYDDAAAIYDDLLVRTDKALSDLSAGGESFGNADLVYNGNTASWVKFGNSFKLKLGMMLADQNPSKANAIIAAAAPGAFTSNLDNAALNYTMATPNTNQIYLELVTSGRKDYVAASTMVDKMNALNDPRIGIYFTDTAGSGKYAGGPYGTVNSYAIYSHPGTALLDPSLPCDFLDYAEVEFLLAEAAARGMGVGGTVESHYNRAISASIQYWQGDTSGSAAYINQTGVSYNTAPGDYKEKIGTQKWIALYNRGFDAWTEWRRLDYPILTLPAGKTIADIPVRFTYPVQEQNLNSTNYSQAASAIGGDLQGTRLFWDIH